ncbi:MAG: hypothetical protein L3K16_06570 [Thermoplasmata archaeon]|nr:hypothetical protein [Thermoplasmata archaeon]
MKKIRPSYPKRREMLKTPFSPLSDEAFRACVADGSAIPVQQGDELLVAKWRDGPGMNPDAFLAALRARGSTLVVRRYKMDVNIRVVRSASAGAPPPKPKSSPRKGPP